MAERRSSSVKDVLFNSISCGDVFITEVVKFVSSDDNPYKGTFVSLGNKVLLCYGTVRDQPDVMMCLETSSGNINAYPKEEGEEVELLQRFIVKPKEGHQEGMRLKVGEVLGGEGFIHDEGIECIKLSEKEISFHQEAGNKLNVLNMSKFRLDYLDPEVIVTIQEVKINSPSFTEGDREVQLNGNSEEVH